MFEIAGKHPRSILTKQNIYTTPALLGPPLVFVAGLASLDAGILVLAFALGWTVISNPCGMAHTCALTPIGCTPGRSKSWLARITLYTLAGLGSAALMGFVIAWSGSMVGLSHRVIHVAVIVGIYCALRELVLPDLPLPEVRRQTRWRWSTRGGEHINPVLWAFDVGLAFATYITFSGVWLIAAVSLASGQVWFGVSAFALYWAGRALPHWIEPMAYDNSSQLADMTDTHRSSVPQLRILHGAAILAFLITLTLPM